MKKSKQAPRKHLREILFFCVIVFIILLGVTIAISEGMKKDSSVPSETTDTIKKTETKHDTSKMKEISAKELTTLTAGKTSVVYIGRDSCSWSIKFSPILNKAIDNLNLDVLYIDLAKIVDIESQTVTDKASYDFLMNLETVLEMNNFMKETFGGTPMVLIIKDSIIFDGHGGYMELPKFTEFLQKNGF